MDYDNADPEQIATAIAAEIGRNVTYQPVATDGAARAATMLAEWPLTCCRPIRARPWIKPGPE